MPVVEPHRHRYLAALLGSLASLLVAGQAAADPCPPARVDPAMSAPPRAWQTALDELVAASADASQPWGCPDSQVSLELPEDRRYALLSVAGPDGRTAERLVGSPADLVPAGKALLARVDPAVESSAPESRRPTAFAQPPAPAPDQVTLRAEDDGPRAYFDGQATSHYVGATDGIMVGGALRATLPVHPWMAGLFGRYEGLVHSFSSGLDELAVDALAVGLYGGYRLVDAPARLDVGLTGSLVILNMDGEIAGPGGVDEQEAEKGAADARLGTELRLGVPLSPSWHALAAVDAELAPGALGGEEDRVLDPLLPPMPAYAVGLSVGVEGALR